MTETITPGTTRYSCPLGCGWHYDEPPPGPSAVAGIVPTPSATTLQDVINNIVEQSMLRKARVVEDEVRGHMATHGIRTVDQLRAVIEEARQPRAPEQPES